MSKAIQTAFTNTHRFTVYNSKKLFIFIVIVLSVLLSIVNHSSGSEVDEFYENTPPEQRLKMLKEWKPANKLEELQRQAFLYEADRDYGNALKEYKQIMEMEDVPSDVKAITHVALQRCYGELKDADNEFKELLWIRDHMFASSGEYRHLTKHLSSNTVEAIVTRLGLYMKQVEKYHNSQKGSA